MTELNSEAPIVAKYSFAESRHVMALQNYRRTF